MCERRRKEKKCRGRGVKRIFVVVGVHVVFLVRSKRCLIIADVVCCLFVCVVVCVCVCY